MQILDTQEIDSFPIALVVSRMNRDLAEEMLLVAKERLEALEFKKEHILIVWATSIFEIPVLANAIAAKKRASAIVCLGAFIRGEAPVYGDVEDVMTHMSYELTLKYNIPVIDGVLLLDNRAQAKEWFGGKRGHHVRDAINAAYESVSVINQL